MAETHKIKSILVPFIDSQQPIVLVVTDEEVRFLKQEQTILTQTGRKDKDNGIKKIYVWDFNGLLLDRMTGQSARMQNARDVIEWFQKDSADGLAATPGITPGITPLQANGPEKHSVLIMFDVMYHMQDHQGVGHSNPGLTRSIKQSQQALIANKRTLVLVSHRDFIPPELNHQITVSRFPLPDKEWMLKLVRTSYKLLANPEDAQRPDKWPKLSADEEDQIATMLLGFRGWEAENVLARAALKNKQKRNEDKDERVTWDADCLREAKIESIKNNPAIEVVLPRIRRTGVDDGSNMIGGASAIKDWFNGKMKMFSEDARGDGIDLPKGAVIFGGGGTGKDWVVEHLAQEIGWTTLIADMAASKGPLQGQSHAGFREIIRQAEAQVPCFLVIPEWEKQMASAFSGVAGSIDPTSQEIFSTWLNWMQRRQSKVFVWAQSNDITAIPAEALRAGRWDALWYMDLPKEWEREDIFRVHLNRTGWDPVKCGINLQELALKTDTYTGAEIRNIVKEAIEFKFLTEGSRADGKILNHEHMLYGLKRVKPAYNLPHIQSTIDAMRKYAVDGDIAFANSPERGSGGQPLVKRKVGSKLAQSL